MEEDYKLYRLQRSLNCPRFLQVVARVEEQASLYQGTLPFWVELLIDRVSVHRLPVVLRAPAGAVDVDVLGVQTEGLGLHHVGHLTIQHTNTCVHIHTNRRTPDEKTEKGF
ncbi:hypothetical protein EYF80_002146 [Liparis tanakae]|uniref:Uncharacterized protein n=1 Tax=Liparis tanakae TaxID=230148 RepID=A0A4Z2JB39_9TELE|nr:hypothetical protein EYF80_002146 [Liparis tanakae]